MSGASGTSLATTDFAVPVQSTGELRAIPVSVRVDKQVRLVEDKRALYCFDTDGGGVDDDDLIIRPNDVPPSGAGRWFKLTSTGTPVEHNALPGLQGGSGSERYHLFLAELSGAQDAIAKKHSQNTDAGTSAPNFSINGANAIKEGDARLSNARTPLSHGIADNTKHSSSATPGKILKADANGLPANATNTDTDVADAVGKKHSQNTDTGTNASDFSIGGVNAVKGTRKVDTANGLQGGGELTSDLSLAPVYGSDANTVCEGNDARLSDARPPSAHLLGGSEHTADAIANLQAKLLDGSLFTTKPSELTALAEKLVPGHTDIMVIEDAGASYAKKKVQLGNFAASTIPAGRTCYVSPSYPNDSVSRRYSTIQAAIDYAQTQTPTQIAPWLILIEAGVYVEQLTIYPNIYFKGQDENVVTISNDLNIVDITTPYTGFEGITFVATATDSIFSLNISGGSPQQMLFNNCRFSGNGSDNNVLNLNSGANAAFNNCWFTNPTKNILLLGSDPNNFVVLETCWVIGNSMINGGTIISVGTSVFGGTITANEPGSAFIFGAIVTQGLGGNTGHGIVCNTSSGSVFAFNSFINGSGNVGGTDYYAIYLPILNASLQLNNCLLGSDGSGTPYSVFADYPCNYNGRNNDYGAGCNPNMHNGGSNVIEVGQGREFSTIKDAVASCTYGGRTIKVFQGWYPESNIVPPAQQIFIDATDVWISPGPGNVIFSMENEHSTLKIRGALLNGNISLGANYSQVILDGVSMNGMIDIVSGDGSASVWIKNSTIRGDSTSFYAISIEDDLPYVLVDRSYLQGFNGYPAIFWNDSSNGNVRIKYSTLAHGSWGDNNPFGKTGGVVSVQYASHHSCYSTDPESGGVWSNRVAPGQRFDTLDPNAMYWEG